VVNGVIGSSRTRGEAAPVAVIEGIVEIGEDEIVEKTRHEIAWNVMTVIIPGEVIDQIESIVRKK
jgi:hypothetical protein